MARSEAEGTLPMNNTHSYLAKYSKSIKYKFNTFRAFCEIKYKYIYE